MSRRRITSRIIRVSVVSVKRRFTGIFEPLSCCINTAIMATVNVEYFI